MRHPPSLLLAAAVFAAVLSGFGWMWMRYGQPMPLMASAAATVETIAR
jgi:CHASE2 domain-containing sensor protein